MKLTIYQAVSNGYDNVKKPERICKECCYTLIDGDCHKNEASMFNRFFKLSNPCSLTPFTIYMDGNIGIGKDSCVMHDWVEEILKDADIAICRHAARKCAYAEIEACLGRKKITSRQAEVAHEYMTQHGHPKNFGLWECGIIVRRSGVQWVKDLQKQWWKHMIETKIFRDQLWLPLAMREVSIPAGRFKTIEMDVRKNNFFTFKPHA